MDYVDFAGELMKKNGIRSQRIAKRRRAGGISL